MRNVVASVLIVAVVLLAVSGAATAAPARHSERWVRVQDLRVAPHAALRLIHWDPPVSPSLRTWRPPAGPRDRIQRRVPPATLGGF
ncbi:MAG: hypothetical protein C4551_03185 [Bacillota bacterium]|nr:MAG: hypothetical protein C4551_03185 [Bacillota bacterium]